MEKKLDILKKHEISKLWMLKWIWRWSRGKLGQWRGHHSRRFRIW